jgi:hypothetical protein
MGGKQTAYNWHETEHNEYIVGGLPFWTVKLSSEKGLSSRVLAVKQGSLRYGIKHDTMSRDRSVEGPMV